MKNSLKASLVVAPGMINTASWEAPEGLSVRVWLPVATTVGVSHSKIHLVKLLWSPQLLACMSRPPTPPSGPTVSS